MGGGDYGAKVSKEMIVNTAHVKLANGQVANLRTDLVLDDGTPYPLENNKTYAGQNTGTGDIRINERESSRDAPNIFSFDANIVFGQEWVMLKIMDGHDYFVWTLSQDGILVVGERT